MDLLYSTAKYIQYFAINHTNCNGKESEKKNIDI